MIHGNIVVNGTAVETPKGRSQKAKTKKKFVFKLEICHKRETNAYNYRLLLFTMHTYPTTCHYNECRLRENAKPMKG